MTHISSIKKKLIPLFYFPPWSNISGCETFKNTSYYLFLLSVICLVVCSLIMYNL